MYLTESYNSPQSVYWALKSLICVGLAQNSAFWTKPEAPYPEALREGALHVLPAPRQILCNHPDVNHHFMLSFAQFITLPFKAVVPKYSKFAYSSSFGFSVSVGGHGLAQVVPDNTLALSRDGMETWAVKYKCAKPEFKTAMVHGTATQQVPAATVQWYPWFDRAVSVSTTIIPPTNRWPDWHIRVHHITSNRGFGKVFTAEGGFAIKGRQKEDTLDLHHCTSTTPDLDQDVGILEGVFETEDSILILSEQGASGIVTSTLTSAHRQTTVSLLKPEPSTNLMEQRTLIPIAEHVINKINTGIDIVLVSKVFAISRHANGGWQWRGKSLQEKWLGKPEIHVGDAVTGQDYIKVSF